MPSLDAVPEGAHRAFLTEIFQMYRLAGRPPLRDIAERAPHMQLPGTARSETIRRTLQGKVIPERWETAYAVYAPLCEIAGVELEALYYDDDRYDGYDEPPQITHKELLKRLWAAAFDGASDLPAPVMRSKVPP